MTTQKEKSVFHTPALTPLVKWHLIYNALRSEVPGEEYCKINAFEEHMLMFQSFIPVPGWIGQKSKSSKPIYFDPRWLEAAGSWLVFNTDLKIENYVTSETSLKHFSGIGICPPDAVLEAKDPLDIKNFYSYLEWVVESFDKKVFCSGYASELKPKMLVDHGDKVVQHLDKWTAAGIPDYRGALLYLLAYTTFYSEWREIPKAQWVIDNYRLFLPYIIMAEKEMGIYDQCKRDDDLPPLEEQTWQQQNDLPRYVVTAANRYGDILIVGARHFSSAMRSQLDAIRAAGGVDLVVKGTEEQGFIDQWDVFMTREEAFLVAQYAGQINTRRPKSGNELTRELFSEDIH